jgi:uncharacterized protein YbbC (DUF1343 family)
VQGTGRKICVICGLKLTEFLQFSLFTIQFSILRDKMVLVKTGLERFIESPPQWILGCRLGLLSNPASVDRNFRHARELINLKMPGQLAAL